MSRQELEQRRVAQVLFKLGPAFQILAIDFGNWQTVPQKVPRKREKRVVFLVHTVKNADCAMLAARQADDLTPRST